MAVLLEVESPITTMGRLFMRACAISLIQSSGVYFTAHLHPTGLVTSFLISYLWFGNAVAVNRCNSGWLPRLCYGLGGAAGFLITFVVAEWLL